MIIHFITYSFLLSIAYHTAPPMQVANPKIWFGSKISSNTNQAKTIEIALLAVDASMTDVPDARLKTCQENAA